MPNSRSRERINAADSVSGEGLSEDVVCAQEQLSRVAEGDLLAFEHIYREFSPTVLALAWRVVRDRAIAEEVAQEVFVHIWSHAAKFDVVKGSALGWIMVLTHRRAVDRVRASQASRVRDSVDFSMVLQPRFDPVAEEFAARMEVRAVREGLNVLTNLQRESILLAYFSGFTYVEVGEILAIPLGTVKSRIRDGMIRLRECLQAA